MLNTPVIGDRVVVVDKRGGGYSTDYQFVGTYEATVRRLSVNGLAIEVECEVPRKEAENGNTRTLRTSWVRSVDVLDKIG